MSKGSGRRPQQEDDKHVSSEWDRLFNHIKTGSPLKVLPAPTQKELMEEKRRMEKRLGILTK